MFGHVVLLFLLALFFFGSFLSIYSNTILVFFFFFFSDSLFLSNLEDKLFRRGTRGLFLPFHSQVLLFTNLYGSSFTSGRLRQLYHSTELSIDHPVLYVLLSLLSLAHILTRQGRPRSGKTKLRVSTNSMSRILQARFPITRQHLSTRPLFLKRQAGREPAEPILQNLDRWPVCTISYSCAP